MPGHTTGLAVATRGDEVAKHTKANAAGVKTERPGMRKLTLTRFETVHETAMLLDLLFGPTNGR